MVVLPKILLDVDMNEGLCFGCGQNNPIGLKLSFTRDGDAVRTEFIPGKNHQGWPGVVHGGIMTSVLDEAMTYAARFKGVNCLTARMAIRLKQPALIEKPLVITSSVTKETRKLIETKATACLRDGTVVAEGKATHFVVETRAVDA